MTNTEICCLVTLWPFT